MALEGLGSRVLVNLETPMTVPGDDWYTSMIWLLLFLAYSYNAQLEIRDPDLLEVDWNVQAWMSNPQARPKFVEEEALASLTAYVMRFKSPQSLERVQDEFRHHNVLLFWLNCI